MGAFIIFRITFKEKKFAREFVNKYHPTILVHDNSDSLGFGAWQMLWKPNTIICFMGFMGYDEPNQIKKELKGKIKYFDWISINDLNAGWNKEAGDKT